MQNREEISHVRHAHAEDRHGWWLYRWIIPVDRIRVQVG